MVPPAKPAASSVRTTSTVPATPSGRARPLAFQALLMMGGKPKAPLPAANARVPDLAKSPHGLGHAHGHAQAHPHASKALPEEKSLAAGSKPIAGSAEDEKPKAKPKASASDKESDLLDPSMRLSAQLAPPLASAPPAATEHLARRARVSLEELVPQVLRRIAWGGDRTKGSVHLELTSGDKVTVHAEGRRVRVEVDGNADLERRIGSRLRAAGIEVEGVR